MNTTYTVTVRKDHCIGKPYLAITNCPLCAAIREQLPDFPLKSVAGTFVRAEGDLRYSFPSMYHKNPQVSQWNEQTIEHIISGKIPFMKVTFSLDKKQQEPIEKPIAPILQPKEKIKYIAVPESLTQQAKEVILTADITS